MHISIYPDFLIEYFRTRGEYHKSYTDLLRINIIERPDNRVVLSKKYLELLDVVFTGQHQFYDDYTTFMCGVMDYQVYVEVADSGSSNIDEGFIALSNNSAEYIQFAFSEKPITIFPRCACTAQIMKPNYHWLAFELAANRNATLRCHDFTSNAGVKSLFDCLFSIPKKIDKITYYDRYCENVVNHEYFDSICGKSFSIDVYSLRSEPRVNLIGIKRTLQGKLGLSCSFFYTTDRKQIHERRLVIHGLIIESDNDFDQVSAVRLLHK